MTEYATTPSAIEEWNYQRSRTAKWVNDVPSPQICYPPSRSPSQDSNFDNKSLWDGSGWEVPSDCESSTSIPPTMMLKYSDSRQELITPTNGGGSKMTASGSKFKKTTDKSIGESGPTARSRSHTIDTASKAPTKATIQPTTRTTSVRPPPTHSVTHNEAHSAQAPTVQASKRSSIRAAPDPTPAPSIHSHPEHVSDPSSSATHASPSVPIEPSHKSHSHVPSHSGSRPRSHSASHPASQIRSLASQPPASHVPSHVSSHLPPAVAPVASHPSHPPSQAVASSRHASEAPPVVYEPPPISSIHSRSISQADSRSSGPPEPITIHPPSVSHHSASGSRILYPATAMTSQSIPVAANVALPPPTAESAALSYRSIPPQHEPHYPVYIQPSVQSSARMSRYHQHGAPAPRLSTKGVQVDTISPQHALPTPISPDEPRYTVHPGRALSNMSTTGLDGGYVLIDDTDAPEEQYKAPKKGSFGSRSGHERASLLSVFGGAGSRFGHSRSRSAGQSNSPNDPPLSSSPLEPIPGSPPPQQTSPLTHRSHRSEQLQGAGAYAYPTPVSPTNPGPFSMHHDPTEGPHPPSIVYAPARHGRTTQFSPPRIMYIPASPQQGVDHSPARSMRRVKTAHAEGSNGVRDSGWVEHQVATGGSRSHLQQPTIARDFAGAGDANYAQTVANANPHAQVTYGSEAAPVAPAPATDKGTLSPPRSHLTHSNSDATSTRTNIAGVGTHLNAGRDRSRSHPRGIIFSASAPQPASSAPHAAMMMPPSQERERGVRDTPYPTPPGSANDHLSPDALITAASQGMSSYRSSRKHRPASVRSIPLYANPVYTAPNSVPAAHDAPPEGKLSTKGLMSRFRDIYHGGDYPEADTIPDESRGRARERQMRESHGYSRHKHIDTRRRANSADSYGSASSASTYYVISNPGQKVRIIVSQARAQLE